MRNKREHLARWGTALGAVGLLERFAATARPALIALTYHRIAEPGGGAFYGPVVSASPEAFRRQMEDLKRRMRIVSLGEWIELCEPGRRLREPAALIAFDDGYRDNFTTAAPILKELGVPATFFLPTGFLDAPSLPWWDEVAYIIKSSSPEKRAGEAPDAAIMTVIGQFLGGAIADERAYLDELAAQAEVHVDRAALGRALFADWEQVRAAIADCPLFSIGSHGRSHRKLAGLSDAEQRAELFESKRILKERIGRTIDALAYPYGWPGAFDERAKALAREAGYRLAFSALEGANRPGASAFDRFALRRMNVGSGDSPVLLRARAALLTTFGRSPL